MHQAWPAFRSFVHCLAKHAGARLWISLALLISVGFLEGSGLLLLLPLLQLIGLGEVSGAGGIGQAAASARLYDIDATGFGDRSVSADIVVDKGDVLADLGERGEHVSES